MAFDYPKARRADIADDYHGRSVPDPYRWLEDLDSDETKAFVAAQNAVTQPYLAGLSQREALQDRMTELWDAPRTGPPTIRAGVAVWSHNDGLQDQPIYYIKRGEQPAEVFLDPNSLSSDGAAAVVVTSLSPDGRHFAYTVSEAGSDRQRLAIRATETGEDTSDELQHLRFTSVAWFGDGFFYNRWPEVDPDSTEPVRNPSVHFHRLGQTQSQDRLIYRNSDDPEPSYSPYVTHDDRFLILFEHLGTSRHNGLLYLDLSNGLPDELEWIRLTDPGEALYSFLHHDEGSFLIHTDEDAANGRVVRVKLADPTGREIVIPESEAAIEAAVAIAGELLVLRLVEASHVIERYDTTGQSLGPLDLPGLGTVAEVAGRFEDDEVFVGYQSFVDPPMVLRWEHGSTEPFSIELPDAANATSRESAQSSTRDSIVVERHSATSSDGRQVGMFVMRMADAPKPGPVEMYGYGGFSISMTPAYSPARLAFCEAGGTVVVTNLRGGTEHGEQWHQEGMLGNKQQVFDDFYACGEYLIDAGITTSGQLGIRGGSNGGLLTAVAMLQRPELFGAVVSQVPVTDMLRYQHFTAGRYWTVEYGDSANSEDFAWLIDYSPLHNVGDASTYPPLLIATAESDDRVVPSHAHKFAAEVQHSVGATSEQPLLLRVETRAGHGLGKPTAKVIEESADVYAFFLEHLQNA